MKLKFKLPGTSRGRIIAVVVLLVLVAFLARGCGAGGSGGGSGSDTAHNYLGKIHVRGFDRVSEPAAANATAIFMGDPAGDIPEAFSGPDLKMRSPAKETSDGPLTLVANGTAAMTKGSDCEIRVYRYHKGEPPAAWKLGSGLAAKVKSGQQEALQVEVGCPFSA